jgi:Holliday junction resolvase
MKLGFLTGTDNEARQSQFKRHEKKVAADLGGRKTVGSGGKRMKGDAHGGNANAGQRIMAEAKSTQHRSMSLKLDWLEKLVEEALQAGMDPVLYLRFDAMKYNGVMDWAVLPAERYRELLETEAKYEGLG